ncbi:ATP-binding protein [Streptomyces sp. NPDC087420]|uniref:ATP-binding protein n=1 Tax=Streptomyces sp. NPDC087420 TaxID=3365785 RepID=UPI0038336A40
MPVTLRGRLALLALVTTGGWVVLLTVAFNAVLGARLRQEADDLLRTRATAVASTIEVRSDGRFAVREPVDDRALDVGVWIYRGGSVIERPAGASSEATADRLAGQGSAFAQSPDPYATRFYALPVVSGGSQVGTVVASVSLDPYRSSADTVLAGSVGLAVLLLGGSYLVTRKVVGRALLPVAEMSARAARWSEHGAARRFGPAARPAELASLAASLDELLDRLTAVLRHERQQSAELSHELRTPLARVIAETDWLAARPRGEGEQRTSHAAIASAAATMREICDTLLSEARTRGGQTPGRCDTAELARTTVRRGWTGFPGAPPLTVRAAGPAVAGVSAAVAERILAPLLDNARRYAVDGVVVECAVTAGAVRIVVQDDGPGVPRAIGSGVFEPGRRGDPADGHDGAGLGLALARRLARAAGGDITLESGASGARFVVVLPLG